MKNAMIEVHDYLSELQSDGFTGYMTLQVHDELIFDFPKRQRGFLNREIVSDICDIMEKAGTDLNMVTPVEASIVRKSWDKKEDYERMVA